MWQIERQWYAVRFCCLGFFNINKLCVFYSHKKNIGTLTLNWGEFINPILEAKIFHYFLTFFLIELRKIQIHIWKALKKLGRVLHILKMPKITIYLPKNALKDFTVLIILCLYQYARPKFYYTRNTPSDFESSLRLLYLRYCYHSCFIWCIIVRKELSSRFQALF